MSEENVDTLKAAYEAFERGDLRKALVAIDSGIEVTDHDAILDSAKEYRGHDGLVQMAMEAAEAFDEHRYEPKDFRPAGACVLVAVRRRGRGKASGVEVSEPQWHVWDFTGGKAVRLRIYVSEAQALEAAGLSM